MSISIDQKYLLDILSDLLTIPSPTGMTDEVASRVCDELRALQVSYEVTRSGAIRAHLDASNAASQDLPTRAVAAHIDTLGAMVKGIKPNGRLQLVMIGHWSSRFAEGARCTLHCDNGAAIRGTILPIKASGHTYGTQIDKQEISWEQVELRLDAVTSSAEETARLGVHVGDSVAIDTNTEFSDSGFIFSRHLDDKAGVACILAAIKALRDANLRIGESCYILFTIYEEVGYGSPHILTDTVDELVCVDNGTFAPGQNTSEFGVTIAMKDMNGPYDRHLTRHMIALCQDNSILHSRDIFTYYFSDAAGALKAGYDVRTALICFGLDASHGHERVHMDSLISVAKLIAVYFQSQFTLPHA